MEISAIIKADCFTLFYCLFLCHINETSQLVGSSRKRLLFLIIEYYHNITISPSHVVKFIYCSWPFFFFYMVLLNLFSLDWISIMGYPSKNELSKHNCFLIITKEKKINLPHPSMQILHQIHQKRKLNVPEKNVTNTNITDSLVFHINIEVKP